MERLELAIQINKLIVYTEYALVDIKYSWASAT